jgi:hypothetical protein
MATSIPEQPEDNDENTVLDEELEDDSL